MPNSFNRRSAIIFEKEGQKLLFYGFLLAACEGIISLSLILSLPKDPDSSWLFGYSAVRILILTIAFAFVIFFLGLSIKARRNPHWANRWFQKATDMLGKERFSALVISFLLLSVLVGSWFLISTYTESTYQTPVRLIASMEIVQTYMLRFAPFAFWGTALSLQTLIFIQILGYGTKSNYHRAISYIALIIVPTLLIIFYVVQTIDPNYYKHITNEDQIIEWLTIVCLILAGIFSFLKAMQQKEQSSRRFWFYLLFALACVLFALEEMSWGQRIFDIQSPQFFLENSDQQEINAHNVLQQWYGFRTKHVAAWVLFIYGTCLPILAINRKVKNFFARLGIPIPPLALAPGFLVSAILMIDIFTGKEEEVGEFCFSLCLFLFMFLEFLSPESDRPTQDKRVQTSRYHRWLQLVFAGFVITGLIIATGLAALAIGG